MEDETLFAYMAGFWDGEGTISVLVQRKVTSKNRIGYLALTPRISAVGTEIRALDGLANDLKKRGFRVRTKAQKRYSHLHKPTTILYVNGRSEITLFLTRMLPYLRIKHRQALLILEFYREKPLGRWHLTERQKAIADEVRELNRRGGGTFTKVADVEKQIQESNQGLRPYRTKSRRLKTLWKGVETQAVSANDNPPTSARPVNDGEHIVRS